jgi:hypothetical protein
MDQHHLFSNNILRGCLRAEQGSHHALRKPPLHGTQGKAYLVRALIDGHFYALKYAEPQYKGSCSGSQVSQYIQPNLSSTCISETAFSDETDRLIFQYCNEGDLRYFLIRPVNGKRDSENVAKRPALYFTSSCSIDSDTQLASLTDPEVVKLVRHLLGDSQYLAKRFPQ